MKIITFLAGAILGGLNGFLAGWFSVNFIFKLIMIVFHMRNASEDTSGGTALGFFTILALIIAVPCGVCIGAVYGYKLIKRFYKSEYGLEYLLQQQGIWSLTYFISGLGSLLIIVLCHYSIIKP